MGCLKLFQLMWYSLLKNKRSINSATSNDDFVSEFKENTELNDKKILLSTDDEHIGSTVKLLLIDIGINVKVESFDTLVAESAIYLKEQFPFNTSLENYDFLVISTESDRPLATDTVEMLSSECNLVGALFLDRVPIGADLFEIFESSCRASTKIILYITKDFIKDDFCSWIITLVYLHRRNDLVNKILPFLNENSLDIELPRCLQLVDKLWLGSKLQIELKWPSIWTPDLRIQRLDRDKHSLLKMDGLRREMLNEFLYRRLRLSRTVH